MDLTIAIPTYNRNAKLKRTIELLKPQLKPGIKIIIIDNCSDVPVADTLAAYLDANIEVRRNGVNIGMSGNFIKCFEACSTEWLWLLGDDDPPFNDAIATIEETIRNNSDLSFINFKCELAKKRDKEFTVSTQDELIQSLDSFGNLLYISLSLFNLRKLVAGYKHLYQYSYTFAPHIAFLFASLADESNKHTVLFTNKEIINTKIRDTKVEESWNWIALSLAIFPLAELSFEVSDSNKKRWQKHLRTHIIGPKKVYKQITRLDPSLSKPVQMLYWFDQIFFRAKTVMSVKQWLYYFIYRFTLSVKIALNKKITERDADQNNRSKRDDIYSRF
jgi:glycosyltransferase involved in cell wall biosynthesis